MFRFIIDASALAKRFVSEAGTPNLDALFERANPERFIVLDIGIAEVVSVLVRKRNQAKLAPGLLVQALRELETQVIDDEAVSKVSSDMEIVLAAMKLIEPYSLNASDSILLSIAIELVTVLRAQGDDLVVVASDQRLLRAARAVHLQVFDPEIDTESALVSLIEQA